MSNYILTTKDEVLEKNINEDNIEETLKEHFDIECSARLDKCDINDLTEDQLSELSSRLVEETYESLILVEDEDFRSKLTEEQTDDYEFGDMKEKDITKIANKCDNVISNFLRLTNDICENEEDDF